MITKLICRVYSLSAAFLITVPLLCCACVCLSFLGRTCIFFELASHFFVQYFIILSLSAALLTIARRPKTAAIVSAFSLVCAFHIAPFYLKPAPVQAGKTNHFRAISANVNSSNRSYDKITGLARDYDPDFIFLMEVTADWIEGLKGLRAEYRYSLLRPSEDCFGVAFFSKIAPETAEIEYLRPVSLPAVRAVFSLSGRKFTIRGTHPLPPTSVKYLEYRNEQLADIASKISADGGSTLLLGDLNVTPWSPYFGDFKAAAGLRNSAEGFGVNLTWPSHIPALLIPIDHCLHSGEIAIDKFETGPFTGSDHYPLIVDFSF